MWQDFYISRDDEIMFGIALAHALLLPLLLVASCQEFQSNAMQILSQFCCSTKHQERDKEFGKGNTHASYPKIAHFYALSNLV